MLTIIRAQILIFEYTEHMIFRILSQLRLTAKLIRKVVDLTRLPRETM